MASFFMLNIILCGSILLVNFKIFKIPNPVDSLMSFLLLFISQIIITELLLGASGKLFLINVILLNLAIFSAVYLITLKKEFNFSNLRNFRASISGLFTNKIILFCFSCLLGFGLIKVIVNLVNPPFGWDCLNYHFTFPVEWLKHGTLDIPITISDDPSPSYYPINGSLIFLWLMLPLRNVFLADLGQVPFFILAFMAIYGISRKLGVSRELSFYASALFLIMPNVFKQLEIAYVDVMFTAFFLCGLNFLIALYRNFSFSNIMLSSISLGLFLGTKTSAVVYGVPLLFLLVAAVIRNFSKVKPAKILFSLLLFIVIVALLGGFTYIRNFILTGNILYPAEIKIFGKLIFKGVMPFSTYRDKWTAGNFNIMKLFFHEGLGVQFVLLIIPAAVAAPFILIRRKKSTGFIPSYISLLPIALFTLFYLLMPQLWVRYLYPFIACGSLLAMYVMYVLRIPLKTIRVVILICFLASIGELSNRLELVTSIIASVSIFASLPLLLKIAVINWKIVSLGLILILAGLRYLCLDYDKYEFPRYIKTTKYSGFWPDAVKAWHWLNIHTSGNNIAYIGRPVPFPLYGTNFKNDVYYVSVNQTEPAKLHHFKNSRYEWDSDFMNLHRNLEEPGNYRGRADYTVWINNLSKRKTDYLFIYSLHQTKEIAFPIEDNWAIGNPDKFKPVFTNDTVKIYKISR